MYRGNSSRIFPIILVLIVIAIAVAAIVSIGRAIFSGDSTNQTAVDTSQQQLLSTEVNHAVRMTVRGAIVADENFRSYQITVTPGSRNLTTYSGYLAQPIGSQALSNNVAAYDEFVHALDKANMMQGEAFESENDDTRGVCATGKVYEFETLTSGNATKRLWTSTCKGSPGSFRGSVSQVQNLFLGQIPDNRTILRDIDL